MVELGNSYSRSVTVVDDESHGRDVVVRAARSWSYECQTANCAEQAIDVLEKRLTPAVVTDLRMPGKGGVWLVREIQRRWPEVGVIVITAGEDSEAAGECLRAGAANYFLKPIKFEEFQHALARASRQWRLQCEQRHAQGELQRKVRQQSEQLRSAYLSAIRSLLKTLEARDPNTCGHSLRVRGYAVRLAKKLGLAQQQCKQISLAAKLHDIGKLGLPEAILNKTHQLTEEELKAVREHPLIGERILSPVIRDKIVLAAIRGHHERVDGMGYPDGLLGDTIPLEARVITIADYFDAVTSSRTYREPMSFQIALDLIQSQAGARFDPRLVSVFTRLFRLRG